MSTEPKFVVIDQAGAWTFDPLGLAGVRRDLATGLGRLAIDRRVPYSFTPTGGPADYDDARELSIDRQHASNPTVNSVSGTSPTAMWQLVRPVFVDLSLGGVVASLTGPVRLTTAELEQLTHLATTGNPGDPTSASRLKSLGLARPLPRVPEQSESDGGVPYLRADSSVVSAKFSVFGVVHSGLAPAGILPLALGQMVSLINSPSRSFGATPLRDLGFRAGLVEFESVRSAAALAKERAGAIWLLSCYSWSTRANLKFASAIKAADPSALIVVGGPDIPASGASLDSFAKDHGYVDFVVHGEGEATLAHLLKVFASGDLDSEPAVDGASRIVGGSLIRGAPRPRIQDLDSTSSPYLDGTFDGLLGRRFPHALVETNRGCPFGCSFCDWGSATLSRIRSFSIERVRAEIDWLTASGVETLGITDANFGILPRDIEIADHIVLRRRETGYPTGFMTNYAKNPRRNVVDIVDRLKAVGLVTSGRVSLQTIDDDVLDAVDRRNIKTSRYLELISAYRKRALPIVTDMMFGLPGSTLHSFRNDLEFLMDADVHASFARTRSLPNAPMAAPSYQEKFGIRLDSVGNVAEALTFSQDDLREILRDWAAFFVADSLGILRIVLRFWRQESGRTEWELLSDLLGPIRRGDAYPYLAWAIGSMTRWTIPLADWHPLELELDDACVNLLGRRPPGWASVLSAQSAHWPHPARTDEWTIQVDHDVASWWRDIDTARITEDDWLSCVMPVGERGPGEILVVDPAGVAAIPGGPWAHRAIPGVWEFDSPMARRGWAQSIVGGIE